MDVEQMAAGLDVNGFVEAVHSDGFAIVEDVISQPEVDRLRDAVAAVPLGEEVRRRRQTYGVRNLLEVCEEVRRLAGDERLRRYATAVLGDDCFAVRAIFFDKVPDANWGLGWHQDSVIAVRERKEVSGFVAWSRKASVLQVQPPAEVLAEMLAIRVHLDDCDEQNGPLRILPGSHRHGWLDNEIDDWRQRVSETVCEVRAGGIVAMRPLLLHASAAAAAPHRRGVIHIEYAYRDLPGGLQWNRQVRSC